MAGEENVVRANGRAKDLRGRRFGRLVCIEPTQERGSNGCVVWKCRCDCGKECRSASSQLMQGYKKSCGCLSHPKLKDYAGRRFGQLTVIGYAGKQAGMHRWRCICDCGKETTVGQTLLQSGKTRSCGCARAKVIAENLKLCEGTSVRLLESGKRRRIVSNTSGCTGVYRRKNGGKWYAQITFRRKTYYLGGYDRFEDAVRARKMGEQMHDNFIIWYYGRKAAEGEVNGFPE